MTSLEHSLATGVAQAITALTKDLISSTVTLARSQAEKLRVELELGFSKYLERNFVRCSKVKTLLHRFEPVALEKAYVDARIQFAKKISPQSELLGLLNRYQNIVITGIAGSGKSMLLKSLFVTLYASPRDRIPIFVEMRYLADGKELLLLSFILEQINALVHKFSMTQLEYCLSKGKFILIFDGIDEIEHSVRDDISKQILDISYKYPENHIIATSRPDERFNAWNEFYVGMILPFEKTQVLELISKIEYDEELKLNFIKQVDTRLYESHRSFLSNPLLCTMMLMTYDEFAEVPSKMHIFYDQAFNVLYNKHDATKPLFRRKFYTSMSVDDLKRLLTVFSLFTYIDRKFSMTAIEANDYVKKAAQYESISISAHDFLKDLNESICILLMDGDKYTFLHRSFQEYFVALFLANRESDRMKDIIEGVRSSIGTDNVIGMLMEMNRETFENKFFKGKVDRLRSTLDRIDVDNNPAAVFKLFNDEIEIENGEMTWRIRRDGDYWYTWSIIRRYYAKAPKWPDIDWKAVAKCDLGIDREDATITEENISDDVIKALGIASYLKQLDGAVRRAEKKINLNTKKKKDLISDMLAPRKSLRRRMH